MRKNFEIAAATLFARGSRFWLQILGGVLAVANGIALFIFLAAPGGSRSELQQDAQQLRTQIAATRMKAVRLKSIAEKVQLSGTQSSGFETLYFLPKRRAYETIMAEVQRIAKASGLQEREVVFSEDPIEGTADLSLLNMTASFEGMYENLMQFLHETDRSPMLLMLDSLQAAPQQKGGQINVSMRFQSIMQDTGGQQ